MVFRKEGKRDGTDRAERRGGGCSVQRREGSRGELKKGRSVKFEKKVGERERERSSFIERKLKASFALFLSRCRDMA